MKRQVRNGKFVDSVQDVVRAEVRDLPLPDYVLLVMPPDPKAVNDVPNKTYKYEQSRYG